MLAGVLTLSVTLIFATARAESSGSEASESCGGQPLMDLLGKWNLKRWETPGYIKYRGNLVIAKQTSPTKFEGVLTFYSRTGWSARKYAIVEDMTITVSGPSVFMQATAVRGAFWPPDTFTLSICDRTMTGQSRDAAGQTSGPAVLN
jgi:hypothetical protein